MCSSQKDCERYVGKQIWYLIMSVNCGLENETVHKVEISIPMIVFVDPVHEVNISAPVSICNTLQCWFVCIST